MKAITLTTDANHKNNKFAILMGDTPVYHGQFFDNDQPKHQAEAEMKACLKAVSFTAKLQNIIGEKIQLTIQTDCNWIAYALAEGGKRNKAQKLAWFAGQMGVEIMEINVIEGGRANPADAYTRQPGFCKLADGLNLAQKELV